MGERRNSTRERESKRNSFKERHTGYNAAKTLAFLGAVPLTLSLLGQSVRVRLHRIVAQILG